jgi:hypothetical protein
MKFSASLLFTSLFCFNSLAYAVIPKLDDFNHLNLPLQEPAQGTTNTDLVESELAIPETCDLIEQAKCLISPKNIEFVKHLALIFSEKKGETVVFSTKHFEEILAKMKELKITKSDLDLFKEDPKLCVEKFLPILELAAKYAELELNPQTISMLCENAASAYTTASNLHNSYVFLNSYLGISKWQAAGITVFALGGTGAYFKNNYLLLSSGAILIYMLLY